jgi:hypothetical protein
MVLSGRVSARFVKDFASLAEPSYRLVRFHLASSVSCLLAVQQRSKLLGCALLLARSHDHRELARKPLIQSRLARH